MTEEEWLKCADSQKMLGFLQQRLLSGRKKRLLVCAACRLIWPLITDARSREVVEVAERFAEGQATVMELEIARAEARAAIPTRHPSRGVSVGGKEWRIARLRHSVTRAAWYTATNPISSITAIRSVGEIAQQRGLASSSVIPHLLRCISGNPFSPVAINPTWLTSNVASLAQAIYQEKAFDRLPIL